MAKRSSLASLLETPRPPTAQQEVGESPSVAPAQGVDTSPAKPDSKPARPSSRAAAARIERDTTGERFDDFTRKEARLREDQIDGLAIVARRLSRQRTGAGPRITENTLIRIAVDRLLADQSQLTGETESELRKSIGL